MGKVKQVAFQIDVADLQAIDSFTGTEFSSRAAVIRAAVSDWLSRRRSEAIDVALEKGYAADPPGKQEQAWADLSVEGLESADLDW